jgi:hypothetical protein
LDVALEQEEREQQMLLEDSRIKRIMESMIDILKRKALVAGGNDNIGLVPARIK